jgi:hypothetical protein
MGAKFKILRAKYRKQFGTGHMFIYTFFLGMTDTMTSQYIDLSSWDTLYISAINSYAHSLLAALLTLASVYSVYIRFDILGCNDTIYVLVKMLNIKIVKM